jgi:hypothetical protein
VSAAARSQSVPGTGPRGQAHRLHPFCLLSREYSERPGVHRPNSGRREASSLRASRGERVPLTEMWTRVCLLSGDGTALSSVSSSAGAATTAAVAKPGEAGIPHMHSCTTHAGAPSGVPSAPAPRFAPS